VQVHERKDRRRKSHCIDVVPAPGIGSDVAESPAEASATVTAVTAAVTVQLAV